MTSKMQSKLFARLSRMQLRIRRVRMICARLNWWSSPGSMVHCVRVSSQRRTHGWNRKIKPLQINLYVQSVAVEVTSAQIVCLAILVSQFPFYSIIDKLNTGNEKYVNRQMDSEYEALMAELGGGKPKGPLGQPKSQSLTQNLGSQQAHINRVRRKCTLPSLSRLAWCTAPTRLWR